MTFTVGGVDVTAVKVGVTPAVAVYVGSKKVWPPVSSAPRWLALNAASGGQGTIATAFSQWRIQYIDHDGIDRKGWLLSLSTGDVVRLTAAGGEHVETTVGGVVDDAGHHRVLLTPGVGLATVNHMVVSMTFTRP